jgi:hypothetical protein
MKIMRLGYSEGTLFLNWFCEKNGLTFGKFYGIINCLFSTSGYYDKKITTDNILYNLTQDKCENVYHSEVFEKYMTLIYEGIQNCDLLEICCHPLPFDAPNLNVGEWLNIAKLHSLLENKKVLIMSCYASLMVEQVILGHCHKIYSSFPKNCTFIPYDTIYTFFNGGPDNDILETFERYKKDLQNFEFDLAIVSCGAYTHILVPFIADVLKKDAITSFATIIADAFGIITQRSLMQGNIPQLHPYWVTVPDKYKPKGYEKLELGAYW